MWQAGAPPVFSGGGRDYPELAALFSLSMDMQGGES